MELLMTSHFAGLLLYLHMCSPWSSGISASAFLEGYHALPPPGGTIVPWPWYPCPFEILAEALRLGRLAQDKRIHGFESRSHPITLSPHVFISAARLVHQGLCGLPVIHAPKRPLGIIRTEGISQSQASNSGWSWNHWASIAPSLSNMPNTQWAKAEKKNWMGCRAITS
jgi:hypothetical protein